MSVQLVVVTTHPDAPRFYVHARARDEFIAELIAARYGTQDDGAAHEWTAYEAAEEKSPTRTAAAAEVF